MARTRIGIELWRDFHNQMSPEAFKMSFLHHLKYGMGKDNISATDRDLYNAMALAVRERLIDRMMATQQHHHKKQVKRVYYLSLEFLVGRSLVNNLINLKFLAPAIRAMDELGQDLLDLAELERDAGLGNGGLGRLAACFLDSLATMDYPALGYGIRYEYGIFRQTIRNFEQVETPDHWLFGGNPWEIERPDRAVSVPFRGRVVEGKDESGRYRARWVECDHILGMPYDLPVLGYNTETANLLRLWAARAGDEFDFHDFDRGDYVEAVEEKTFSETISKVLYPNDSTMLGKELRFLQQHFFTCCSVTDIVRRYKAEHQDFSAFPDQVAIQLNDTHPALAVLELMRVLLDEEGLDWDFAWSVVTRTVNYTNHTLLPEALEKWSVAFFERLLPRHLHLVYEINRRFLLEVRRAFPGDPDAARRMSLITEEPNAEVRMAYLAIVASNKVNGVAALHTELLQKTLVPDFARLWPDKFTNKTNGVTPRRWLLEANPELAALITEAIGDRWTTDLDRLRELEKFADDGAFLDKMRAIKRANKEKLLAFVRKKRDLSVNPDSLFDVQVKRIHEYKRQHLNLLHVIDLYFQIKDGRLADAPPRTVIFGGKAAPGYAVAKNIIKAINVVAHAIDQDPEVKGRLKVVFLPDYKVSLAQRIFPASDLSEQISTAGKEASGTGNMKFALNGALTIGTLDGANIEIAEEVGDENIFIFGLTAPQVAELRPRYDPFACYSRDHALKRVLDALIEDRFTPKDAGGLRLLTHSLLEGGDPFLVLADFAAYCRMQRQVEAVYQDQKRWARMALLNIARMGKFSSDRTIREYAEEIWRIKPEKVEVPSKEKKNR